MRQRIFIGGSGEALEVCRAIQAELKGDFAPKVWNQDVFKPSASALESLVDALDASDAGIFVLRPDDLKISRGTSSAAPRDNVVLELGMFFGRVGRERTFMLTPEGAAPMLPTDLWGITPLEYDAALVESGDRAGVGPACRTIRIQLRQAANRFDPPPEWRERLDAAMVRMGRDLESLVMTAGASGDSAPMEERTLKLGQAEIVVAPGLIQDAAAPAAVALPANEFFDDECVKDKKSSLGAYVAHHFGADPVAVLDEMHAHLERLPSEPVPRTRTLIEHSYGIGRGIYLDGLAPEHRLILVSATTQRAAIGLRAEPHFLYAALEGIIGAMNENRLKDLVMPLLGAGHGAMPVSIALLFNLLALRSILTDDLGRGIRNVRIVIFPANAAEITNAELDALIARVT